MSGFPINLKTMRQSRGYTQKSLAVLLGISKSTISMYENGNREPDFETLEALADIFNVPLASLLGSEKEPALNKEGELTTDSIRLAEKIDCLSEESRRELEKYIDYLVSQAHQ